MIKAKLASPQASGGSGSCLGTKAMVVTSVAEVLWVHRAPGAWGAPSQQVQGPHPLFAGRWANKSGCVRDKVFAEGIKSK